MTQEQKILTDGITIIDNESIIIDWDSFDEGSAMDVTKDTQNVSISSLFH